MNRSEFLKWISLTPLASLVTLNAKGEAKPVNKKAEKSIQTLYGAFHNRESVELFGMEFYIEGYEIYNEDIPIGDKHVLTGNQQFRLTLIR